MSEAGFSPLLETVAMLLELGTLASRILQWMCGGECREGTDVGGQRAPFGETLCVVVKLTSAKDHMRHGLLHAHVGRSPLSSPASPSAASHLFSHL